MLSYTPLRSSLMTLCTVTLLTSVGCSTTGGVATTGPSQAEIDECERRYKESVAATEDTRSDSPDRIVSNNDVRPPSTMELGTSNNPCIPKGQRSTVAVQETDSMELAKDRARLLLQQGKVKEAKLAMVLGFKQGAAEDTTLLPLTRRLQAQLQPQMVSARGDMLNKADETQGGCFFSNTPLTPETTPVVIFEDAEQAIELECVVPRPITFTPEHAVTLNIEKRIGDNNYKTVLSERVRSRVTRVGQSDVVRYTWTLPKMPKTNHAYFRTYLEVNDGKSDGIRTSDSGFFWFK